MTQESSSAGASKQLKSAVFLLGLHALFVLISLGGKAGHGGAGWVQVLKLGADVSGIVAVLLGYRSVLYGTIVVFVLNLILTLVAWSSFFSFLARDQVLAVFFALDTIVPLAILFRLFSVREEVRQREERRLDGTTQYEPAFTLPTGGAQPAAAPSASGATVVERIAELKQLHEQNLITTADFEAKKAALLKEL